jgi:hypothetical protein
MRICGRCNNASAQSSLSVPPSSKPDSGGQFPAPRTNCGATIRTAFGQRRSIPRRRPQPPVAVRDRSSHSHQVSGTGFGASSGREGRSDGTVLALHLLLAHPETALTIQKANTVCIVGAADDFVDYLAALLDEHRQRLDAHWQVSDHASADLLLIDAESVHGHMDWLRASSSGRLAVACSNARESCDAKFLLAKPVIADELVAMLNRIGADLGAQPGTPTVPLAAMPVAWVTPIESPTTPAANASSVVASLDTEPAAAATLAIDAPPEPHLVDFLGTNPPLRGRMRLTAVGLPSIFLDPDTRKWHADASLKGLSSWCTRALMPGDAQAIGEVEYHKGIATLSAQPYARLEWLTHLVHGEGRLNPGLDPNGRYKLARWPQSEREFPKHFRIATMMLKEWTSIDEVAELSGATIAEVVNFINAYHALAYIEYESPTQAPQPAQRSGLFARMRKVSSN